MAPADVEANFRDLFALFPLCLPHPDIFDLSFHLQSRFSLSHWDSMLLAACKTAGVDRLYTEDLDSETDYDGLAIVNPFA
jgi:predicted nucleic acid-binding protein